MSQSQELQKAAECDKTGRHEEAIQWLIAAARNGEHSALTELGRRYLIGDRVQPSPPHGVQLLQKGAELGEHECSLLLSVLHAIGHHVNQDWNLSLQHLVLAAEQGSDSAREQLELLCGNKKLAGKGGSGRAHLLELARHIDLRQWHTPCEIEMLCENPKIGRVKALVSKDACKWLIKRSDGKLSPALVYDSVNQKTIRHSTRTNSSAVFGFLDTSVLATLLQVKIAVTMKVAFKQLEAISVLHYKGGEEITDHFDFIDPNSPNYEQQIAERGDRIVTFLVYLNDNYDGGETNFPRAGVRHKGTRGEGLFVVNVTETGEPNLQTMHAGLPPTSGEKWIITQFIRNKATF